MRPDAPILLLIVQLQKITLLVQLIRMAVEEGENGLQLGYSVFVDIHEGRLVCLDYG